jgi:tetratricopeptide (TPR) repeat protein
MRVLIDNWLGIDSFPELTPDKTEYVKEHVNQIFTADEIDYWRIKVLSSLGIPSFALKILETNKSISNSYFVKIQKGRSYFHAGRYKTARRYFMSAMKDELLHGKALTVADAALEMSDAYRSYGSPIRAYISTFLVSVLAQKTLRAKKLLKQSLIVKDAIEISAAIRRLTNSKFPQIAFFSNYIFASLISGLQKILSRKLIECAKEALKTGNWIDFQQVALIAESLEVDISSVSRDEYYLPPKAAEGYRHLAYYVPQTMIFYDYCLKNKNLLATDVNIKAEWKKHVKICKQIGLDSSLWKILALSESQKIKNEAGNIFNKCEYGFFKRIFDWRKFALKS